MSVRGEGGVTRWCVVVTCDVPGLFMPSGHNEDGSTSRVREYTEDLYFAGPGVLKLHTSDLQDWQWDYAIQDLYQHDWVYVPATRDIKCRRDLLQSHTFTRTYVYPRVDFFVPCVGLSGRNIVSSPLTCCSSQTKTHLHVLHAWTRSSGGAR